MKTKIDLEGIDNIIFDLGMVIIDLETGDTDKAFKRLFQDSYEKVLKKLEGEGHFEKYETGAIGSDEFINGIAKLSDQDIQQEVPKAWNAMLKKIPDVRFEILKKAKAKFNTFCLSNTNELHIEFIYDYLQKEKKIQDLNSFFHKVYLSHEIGMRKPNKEIFDFVLKENELDPQRTLFIDDTAGHLEGAKKCGIRTFHLAPGMKLENIIDL